MRTFLVLLAVLAVIPSAAAVGTPAALTLSVSSHKVLYGHGVTLSGKLTGKAAPGRAVAIEARRYGSSAPHVLATVRTDIGGSWSFKARPTIRTAYWARVGSAESNRVTIGVAPAVSVRVLPNGRVRARVHAAVRFNRRFVELQTRTADGSWKNLDRRRLSTASIAVFPATLPTGTIRVAMSINQAGAGYLGAASHAIAYRLKKLTLASSTPMVLFGHRVTLTGRLVNGRAGDRVAIFARPYGRRLTRIATVSTTRSGRFMVVAHPGIQTAYQARFLGTQRSGLVAVGVRPAITAEELANGRIRAHVAASTAFRGRDVQLQRLMPGNTWRTLAKRPLLASSTATFAFPAVPNWTLRVALSVNQAGAGYLGSTSHPLLYRAV